MYQKLSRVAMNHDKPLDKNTKCETQAKNARLEKNFNFDFKIELFQETLPNDSTEWSRWTGNGNSGMDAVAQANGIDETQLSRGHRKRPKKRTWKIETTWNMIHGVDENAQWNENVTKADTVSLHDSRDKNVNVFFESTNSSKLEQLVLQWAGWTVQHNVDSVWSFW